MKANRTKIIMTNGNEYLILGTAEEIGKRLAEEHPARAVITALPGCQKASLHVAHISEIVDEPA